MKKINKHRLFRIVPVLLVAAMVFTQISCKETSISAGDYDEPLSLTGVRYASPDSTGEIEKIGPGDVIALEGTNMNSVAHVYFNGYEATFNPALATKDHLVITVPTDIPFGTMDPNGEEMNKIMVTNSGSEAVLDMTILPPPPQINSISNEYAEPGEIITLSGQYLYLATEIVFPGGVQVDTATVSSAPDGIWMELTVPNGATTEGEIVVTSTAGVSTSIPGAEFLQTDGMLCNFDDQMNWEWWSAMFTSDATNFPGANGNFAVMTPDGGEISSGDNSWWNSFRSINLSQGQQWVDPANLGEPLANFGIKFELAIHGEWNTGTLLLRTVNENGWTYSARYEPWRVSEEEVDAVEYDGWRTVTIPFNRFKGWGSDVDGGGSTAPSLQAILPDGVAPYPGIMLINDRDGAVPADLEFAVDNIRVVRLLD